MTSGNSQQEELLEFKIQDPPPSYDKVIPSAPPAPSSIEIPTNEDHIEVLQSTPESSKTSKKCCGNIFKNTFKVTMIFLVFHLIISSAIVFFLVFDANDYFIWLFFFNLLVFLLMISQEEFLIGTGIIFACGKIALLLIILFIRVMSIISAIKQGNPVLYVVTAWTLLVANASIEVYLGSKMLYAVEKRNKEIDGFTKILCFCFTAKRKFWK